MWYLYGLPHELADVLRRVLGLRKSHEPLEALDILAAHLVVEHLR